MSNNRINNNNNQPGHLDGDGHGNGQHGYNNGGNQQVGHNRDKSINDGDFHPTGRNNGPISLNLRIGDRDGGRGGDNDNQVNRGNNGNHYGQYRHHDFDGDGHNDNGFRHGRGGNTRILDIVNLGDFWRNTLNNNRNNVNTNPITNNVQDNNVNYQHSNNQPQNINPTGNNQNLNVNPTITNQAQSPAVQSQIPTYQANNQYARNFYNPPQNFSPTNYPSQTTNNNPVVTAPTFNQSSNPVSWNNINNPNIVTLPRNDHGDAGFRGVQPDLISSATNFLRGVTNGLDLSPELRQVLSVTSSVLGSDFVNRLDPAINAQSANLLTRTIENVNNQLVNPGLHLLNLGNMPRDPNAAIRVAIEETISSYQLSRYLDQMGKGGGNLVQQAEEVLTNFLFGIKDAPANLLQNTNTDNLLRNLVSDKLLKGFTPEEITQYLSFSKIFRDINPAEVLRDLRNGSFTSPYEIYNPFPLTGRARVASEMIELMHLLDRVEQFAQYLAQQKGALGQSMPLNAEALKLLDRLFGGMDIPEELLMMLKTALANGKVFTLEEFMQLWQVAFPGRAARSLIPEIALALNGLLPNLDGKFLTAKDGTPLILDKLVWFNLAGGMVSNFSSMFDNFPTRLSPLLLYGFDAIYTLIGFDGRSLAHQHFAAVQANINDSEPEWIFGEEPFSMGWMRAMIERLKDSHVMDHNLLGEQLEEAMAHGCFHTLLVNVAVEKGSPVTDNIRVTPVAPGFAGDFAFASTAAAG